MNNLSWLIYFAEVAGNIKFFFNFAGILVFLTCLYVMISSYIEDQFYDKNWKKVIISTAFGAILVIVSLIVPSQKVIYMIAASEVGEQVIKTPEAKEVFDSLKARILDELKVEAK